MSCAARPFRVERGEDIEEQRLGERVRREARFTARLAHVLCACQIDLVDALEGGTGVVTETFAVALVKQQRVIVDGVDIADSRILRLAARADVGERISELGQFAAAQIDAQDARVAAVAAAILNQQALHHAVKCVAVERDRETFHALVGDAPRGVLADLVVADGRERRHRERCRHSHNADPLARAPIEAVDIRPYSKR